MAASGVKQEMIVRARPRVWELFTFWRLSVLPQIAWQIVSVVVLSIVVVVAEERWPTMFRNLSPAPFTLLGIALSIFLGFRNSACYDRWWEGRRYLGAMIGDVRSLARVALATAGGNRARRERFVRGLIGYSYALMAHLRSESMPTEVAFYCEIVPTQRNVPDALLRNAGAEMGEMMAAGEFGEMVYVRLDERLAALASCQVACERLKGTPVPFTYTLLLHRTAYAYCFLLPFGLVGTMGWGTPVIAALVAYAFFGLDALGDELQDPFGTGANCLPLNAMARTIEISLLEALGAENVPEPLKPMRSVLR